MNFKICLFDLLTKRAAPGRPQKSKMMKAKDFVLEKMPKARAQKEWAFALMQKVTVWYIYDNEDCAFAGGMTESSAWEAAKEKLENK